MNEQNEFKNGVTMKTIKNWLQSIIDEAHRGFFSISDLEDLVSLIVVEGEQ
jgi:hypothetical protein